MTGRGWVGTEGSRPEVGAEGAGLEGGGAKLSGSKVDKGNGAKDGGDISGLAVEAGWGVCRFVYTLIAMLESKVEKQFKTLIYRFAVQPDS